VGSSKLLILKIFKENSCESGMPPFLFVLMEGYKISLTVPLIGW